MLDIKFIRQNADSVKKAITDKQLQNTINLESLLEVDKKYLQLLQKTEDHRALRNQLSSDISKIQDQNERQKLINEASKVKEELSNLETELKELDTKLKDLLLWVPNIPAHDVPVGTDESDNQVIKTEGQKPKFDFEPKHHLDIGQDLDIIDTTRGTKIAGFRGYFLKNEGMLLEQALLKYALDFMTSLDFTPMSVPLMVNKEYMVGTGYFPWGAEDHYYTQDDQALIGTSEVSITAYYADEMLDEKELPIKMVGLSPCFRREIGSHGRDTKGVFRVHHFNKVEQVVLTSADEELTREWHEKMRDYSEQILKNLQLHYQVLLMCTGDMGAGQRKKYDLEAWFPGLNKFGEVGSASYFNDFQSRRLNMRYKTKTGESTYVYTLNNTVLPSPRMLAAVLENYQQDDGSVRIPDVLVPYMNGVKTISKKH